MSTLSTLVARHAALDGPDLEWLHLLVGDWQVLSDLAFADLVLWLPTDDDGRAPVGAPLRAAVAGLLIEGYGLEPADELVRDVLDDLAC